MTKDEFIELIQNEIYTTIVHHHELTERRDNFSLSSWLKDEKNLLNYLSNEEDAKVDFYVDDDSLQECHNRTSLDMKILFSILMEIDKYDYEKMDIADYHGDVSYFFKFK